MIPVDQILPGFATAFDTNAMSTLLTKCLTGVSAIETCRIERFRYRQGERASFLYELMYRPEVGGGSQKLWVNGSLFKGKKAKRIYGELASKGQIGHILELGMLVELFPFDRRMNELKSIIDASSSDLAAGFCKGFGEGTWEIVESNIRPVRYRPGIAAVFRALVTARSGSRTETRSFFVKVYGEGDPLSVFERHNQERCGSSFEIIRPLAVLPALKAIIWPEARGTSLAAELLAAKPDLNAISDIASALSEFHGSGLTLPEQSPAQTVARAAQKNATFIATMAPSLSALGQDLAARIPSCFPETGFAPMHHDMKPEHLLQGGGFTTFIDIEGIVRSDPLIDIGNLLARIHSGSALFDLNTHACNLAMQIIKEKSVDASIRSVRNRLSAAFAFGKMKLATFAISHQLPGWLQLAETQLEDASLALLTKEVPAG